MILYITGLNNVSTFPVSAVNSGSKFDFRGEDVVSLV